MKSETLDLLFLYAESPVHWGTGTSVGVVDLPIQRERHTDYPMGQASGIKGALRAWFESRGGSETMITAAFGPDSNASDHAGCVAFGDARLVLFPVRSLRGTFAYCTTRIVLARLERDLELAGRPEKLASALDDGDGTALVAEGSSLEGGGRVVLEEFPVAVSKDKSVVAVGEALGRLAAPATPKDFWTKRLSTHLCVLPEDLFRDLVRMATTIETHVKIDNKTGTAKDGGLFYEELLPSDAVLYCPTYVSPPLRPEKRPDDWPTRADEVRKFVGAVDAQRVQMGAGSTTGRGIVMCRWHEGGIANG
ncbi:MAG: type III-B CRISPR module RAMP protein Cmr4 [Candidatus Binatia bacterium]